MFWLWILTLSLTIFDLQSFVSWHFYFRVYDVFKNNTLPSSKNLNFNVLFDINMFISPEIRKLTYYFFGKLWSFDSSVSDDNSSTLWNKFISCWWIWSLFAIFGVPLFIPRYFLFRVYEALKNKTLLASINSTMRFCGLAMF